MSARALLNAVHSLLLESHTEEELDAMLTPPTPEEKKARRIDELRAAGLLDHPAVVVA